MNKTIMDVGEIAKYLSFSTKKIYRLAEEHKIPAIRVGRQYRFVKLVIDEWLKEKSISSIDNCTTKETVKSQGKG